MNPDSFTAGLILHKLDAAFFEHELAGFDAVSVGIFIVGIDDSFDAGLNDSFGAFIAGKKSNIKRAASKVGNTVKHGIKFGVTNVRVFSVEWVAVACPRHFGISNACWHTVIANGDDFMFRIDDAGANLRVRVFAAFGGEMGDAHEVLVPANVIFAHFVLLD